MPKYVIEREMPGAGRLSANELQGAAAKSCDVLRNLGSDIQWVQSFVTEDKLFCIYNSPSESLIEEHARKSGFPANRIREVRAIIDPTTAEA
jgi:Nickel responsive protein SCO4226-like